MALYGAGLGISPFLGPGGITEVAKMFSLFSVLRIDQALKRLSSMSNFNSLDRRKKEKVLLGLHISLIGILLNVAGNVLWIVDSFM
jgi:hypothetical protein